MRALCPVLKSDDHFFCFQLLLRCTCPKQICVCHSGMSEKCSADKNIKC